MSSEGAGIMADTAVQRPKVTLYWLDMSRSQRIFWLLEECKGMDYEVKTYKRGKDFLAPAELKEIHPLGKSPVIGVEAPGMKEPVILAESGAISEYLSEYFAPHLIPKRYQEGKEGQVGGETEQWIRYRYFMHYAEGSLFSLLLIALFMDQIKNAPVPFFIKPITRSIAGRVETMYLNKNFETHFKFLESQLKTSPEGGKYLCGKDLTAADIMMSFPIFVIFSGRAKIDKEAYPAFTEYKNLLEQNEVYQRSVKKAEEVSGEPFKSML